MSQKYLHRGDAPLSEAMWAKIDEAVVGAAKGRLCARRLLSVDGPYGLGLKTVPGPESVAKKPAAEGVTLTGAGATPVAVIRAGFNLNARDIAAWEAAGLPIDLAAAAKAAIACAKQEDALLFYGSRDLGVDGLLNARGTQSVKLKSWDKVGQAVDDVIGAVTLLDDAGFHGPYSLALAPALYNLLFRRYTQGNQTELEHMKSLITDGIVKAADIDDGGVLIASGRQYASIVIGQDLATAFIGPADGGYDFMIVESLALHLAVPSAAAVLKK